MLLGRLVRLLKLSGAIVFAIAPLECYQLNPDLF